MNNGTKLRLYYDGKPLTDSDIPNLSILPRVATNKESPGWQGFIKGKKSFTIPANALRPISEPPEPIEREVQYYYRRGNRMFFIITLTGQRFVFTVDAVPVGLKYGVYPAKFGFN